MSASKKLTLNAAGDAAAVSTPTVGDIFTSLLDSNVSLTGMYKYVQEALLVVGGMAIQNYRLDRGLNPFSKA